MMDYRQRIYASYGKNFQDAPEIFNVDAARRIGRLRRYHLRGWMPADRNADIVDLACGGGQLLYFYVEQGYTRVQGCDISPDQVALSRQVVKNVYHGDIIAFLRDRPSQFDMISAYDIIEHLQKNEVLQFLDGAQAALKPGGRLVLQTPNADGPWGASCRYGDFTHEVGFNANSLGRLLRLTGFVNIEARECPPAPYGYSLVSSIRYALWRLLRFNLLLWNLVETGSRGRGILTRVFLMSGVRGHRDIHSRPQL